MDDDPFAVQHIALCPESRYLGVAGASSQVLLFKFKKHEHTSECPVLEIPIIYEVEEEWTGGQFDFGKVGDTAAGGKTGKEYFSPIRAKTGPQKKSPGYQTELICLTPWVDGDPPGAISALAVNSSYGL
jgi:syntaxin-binding protein 5